MRERYRAVFSACSFFLLLLLAPPAAASCQLTYLGCYVDSPDRLLPTQTADAFTCLTREYCASLCASVGAPVSGGEFAGQCFCGPSLPPSAVKAPDSECNMACSGDAQTMCGGSYRISVSSAVCTGPPQPSPCAYNVSGPPSLPPPSPPATYRPPPSSRVFVSRCDPTHSSHAATRPTPLSPPLRSRTSAPTPRTARGPCATPPFPCPSAPPTSSAACPCPTRSPPSAPTPPRCPLAASDRACCAAAFVRDAAR
jgi:hypothetical protein